MERISKGIEATAGPCTLKSLFSRKAGRPSNAMAGEVEERILDAATAVFLENGFGGASLERIAEAAGASKATLYSRYSGKEALFADMVRRNCERSLRLVYAAPKQASLPAQLMSTTRTIVARLLSDEVLGMIRLVIADAPRFPALATLTRDEGRSRAVEAVAIVIAEYATQRHPGERSSVSAEIATVEQRSRLLAIQVLDAIISPMLMRALLGEHIDAVRNDVGAHVEKTIGLFVAAGALDDFV